MKNKKILWTALPFLAGAIFGIFILGLFSFTSPSKSPAPNPAIARISVADANVYFKNYYRSATPYTSTMKGFNVALEELTVMNSILAADPTVAGFRCYFGTNAGASIMIICGVDAHGSDMTGNIYSSTATNIGPCPPICDLTSPITQ